MSWTYRGITGNGKTPTCLGKFEGKTLAVMGGGRCVWDDFTALAAQGFSGHIMCVNDIGMYLQKPFHHWVSLHPDYLIVWKKLLDDHGVSVAEIATHTYREDRPPHTGWRLGNRAAFSGLFAAQVGVCLGYDEVVLCGIPADDSGRFFDPPWAKGNHDSHHAKAAFSEAVAHAPEMGKRVRSMSGWTKQLFETEKSKHANRR